MRNAVNALAPSDRQNEQPSVNLRKIFRKTRGDESLDCIGVEPGFDIQPCNNFAG
jgi:hypothetical protein